MADEEQGGEQIGRLYTEIDGDLTPLEAALQKGLKQLEAFIQKEYQAKIGVQFEDTGGTRSRAIVDRTGRQIGTSVGQSALGQIETKLSGAKIKDVRVEAKTKVDKDTLVAAIQGSLNGHPFKVTLDQGFIRQQIQEALGSGFSVGVGGTHAAAAGIAHQPQQQGLSDSARAELDKRLNTPIGGSKTAIGQVITAMTNQLRQELGQEGAAHTSPSRALEDMIDRFGTDINSWSEKITALTGDTEGGLGASFAQIAKKLTQTSPLYQDVLAAGGGQTSQPQVQSPANTAFIEQVARKMAQAVQPAVEKEPRYDYGEATYARTRRYAAGLAEPTTLKDLFKGLPSGGEPTPSFQSMLQAALSGAASQGGPGTTPPRSLRYGGRGFVRQPFGGPLPTGTDVEADAEAASQLGNNRANVRRLRGKAAGVAGGIPFDIENVIRALERGSFRNIAREEKTGDLHEFTPRNADDITALSQFRRRTGSKRFSLEGIPNQLKFVKPQDIVAEIIRGMLGDEAGTSLLSSPEVQKAIQQGVRQGGANKPYTFPGASSGATRLGGKSVEASAREVLRLQQLLKETDQSMAEVETRLESLAGSGKPTDRLEGTLSRLGQRRQRLATEVEAITPNTDRKLSARERGILVAGSSRARGESREAIESGAGLTPIERALKAEHDPVNIARNIAEKMQEGLVPAYETLIDSISDALANAQPTEQGGKDPFAAGRDNAVREAKNGLLRQFGLADENDKRVSGRGEDRHLFDLLFKEAEGEARSTSYAQRKEGERASNLLHSGTGRGRVAKPLVPYKGAAPAKEVDLANVSPGGSAIQKPVYARPTTSLDTEMAGLRKKYDDAARAVAQKQLDALDKKRAKNPNDYDPVGIDDLLFSPRIRKAGGGTTPKTIKPSVAAKVESTTDVGKRVAEIRRIQSEADVALRAPGPAIPLASGRKRSTVDDRAARIKELGLEPAVEKESLEVLRQNARGQRTPYTKAGREVPSGDQTAEAFAAAVEGRERRPTLAAGAGGGAAAGGGGGGDNESRGGFSFPIPLPVAIVESIPLTIMGGRGLPAAATEGGAASAAEKAETAAAAVVADENEDKFAKGKRRKNINPRSIGTEADQGRVYTFEPDEENEAGRRARAARAAPRGTVPQSATERDFLSALHVVNKPGPTEEQQEITSLRRRRRLQSQARLEDPIGLAKAEDIENDEAKQLRSQLRILNRRIPNRSFGASLTNLLGSIGNKSLERQLQFGGLAEGEAREIETARRQRAQTKATIHTLDTQIVTARTSGRPERVAQLEQARADQVAVQGKLNEVIKTSTARFNTFYKEATKASTVFKSFSGAALGGAAAGGLGSLQFALGAVIAQPIMQAFGALADQVLAPAIERVFKFPGAATEQVTNLAQLNRGAGGREDVALAQLGLQTGNTLGPAGEVVSQRAALEAGNKALGEQTGLLRASLNISRNGGPQAALTQSLGGLLGSSVGGTPSIDEIIGQQLDLNPALAPGAGTPERPKENIFEKAAINFGFGSNKSGLEILQDAATPKTLSPEELALASKNLAGLNEELKKGTDGTAKFVDATQIGSVQIERQATALDDAGFKTIAAAVRGGKGVLLQEGHVVTDPDQLTNIFNKTALAATKPSPEDFLAAQQPQLKAQAYLTERQFRFQQQQLPIQEGIQIGAQPFEPATSGFAPKDAAKYKTELGGVQSIFDQLTKDATASRAAAVEFFRAAPGSTAADTEAFATSLGKAAQYGQQIADIQVEVQTQQAALEAKQYSFQIFQVKRSLNDALGLTGKLTDATSNLGVIERQQFELQRQAQSLSLGQSQRQINFQRAIAGLTAPGLTGEERAARIQQAKIEANYAQKQLDIQKKLFGLGGRQFRISADRNVTDLTRQLGLLSQGREVTLRTAVAAKQVRALTALQDRENKRISLFYQHAVDTTGQVMQLEAQLVANTEVDLNKVGNLVLNQFVKNYRGMIQTLRGLTLVQRTQDQREGPSGTFATGGVFNTRGAANITVGESGSETVAVLRNPRPFAGSLGGGGGTTVVIDLRGANVSDDIAMRKLTASVQQAVERGLAKKGSLYGLN